MPFFWQSQMLSEASPATLASQGCVRMRSRRFQSDQANIEKFYFVSIPAIFASFLHVESEKKEYILII